MVLLNKTLVIFDTNALTNITKMDKNGKVKDKVIYQTFEFGLPFKTVESYIVDKELFKFVELAVPRIVIDELKRQKSRSYHSDISVFIEIHRTLTQLPYENKDKILLPDTTFNYLEFVEQAAEQYLGTKKLRIIELPDDACLKQAFQRIIKRALNTKQPFRKHGDQSDVGFKDALIWESILSYPQILDFDKVIFLTADGGFGSECTTEFENTFHKYFSIQKTEGDVTDELAKDYSIYLENYHFIKFSKTDVFISHLHQQIVGKKILIPPEEQNAYPITSFEIIDPCEYVESIQEPDNQENVRIKSRIKVHYEKDGQENQYFLTVSTTLDDVRNVLEVFFEPELIEP